MGTLRKTGGLKEFYDSGDVEPLEPERTRKIKEGYKKYYEAKAEFEKAHKYLKKQDLEELWRKEIREKQQAYINRQKKDLIQELPAKLGVSKGIIVLIVIAIIGFSALYFFFNQEDSEQRIFEEANEKCSVYVESFCPTKAVEVEGETFDCLWDRKDQECQVWWKK